MISGLHVGLVAGLIFLLARWIALRMPVAVALLWQLARSEYSRGGSQEALRPVAGVARVQWYMSLGLVPVTALFFNQVSLISPFVNVIAIPLFSFVLDVLDVGHGLAVLVETRSHTLIYDAGALYRSGFDTGREIVLPAMRAKSWETLDAVVVSHADNDHAGGIPAMWRRRGSERSWRMRNRWPVTSS